MKTIYIKNWKDLPDNFTGIVINQYGNKYYFQNGKYHRTDGGPAIECTDGYKAYFQNDHYHRLDGPAIEYADGDKYWYILDQELTEKQHNLFQKLWDQTDVDKTDKTMKAYVTLVTVEEQTI